MDNIIQLRHELHQNPELSGMETETADRIVRFFESLAPDMILKNLGRTGVAVVFSGTNPGPTVLLRAELDALPIQESNHMPYCSLNQGVAHKCGHDGHMAILAAIGESLAAVRPTKGRVVLLFQPAEENGAGAKAVVSDPRFAQIAPDFVYALHNIPGFPLGQVVIRNGSFSSASRGISIRLSGAPAHAAQPETGRSPAQALAEIIETLSSVPPGTAPAGEVAFITVVGAQLGEKAFGTAPAQAEIWATLRSETDPTMAAIIAYTEKVVQNAATAFNLDYSFDYSDIFPATVNSARANEIIRLGTEGPVLEIEHPFRWSEDFGHLTEIAEGALFGIGAGVEMPELHNSDYDFPDELIPPATRVFKKIIAQCLEPTAASLASV
jgi:amidohydrolase